ncbi:hypothetical protein [Acinetobacter equi]|uniref:Outer membrane protein beta-barrel domain-containing protein n=1 Tax=Acinetobacter equi TaxID=1324350 RepID=A0A0N9VSM5_9GAMM|nr:hypothetical protein [Acinetobacter equi]ALH96453.1 hypothetical protein AOY20_13385 [Acinetobacter equi]
MNKKILIFVVFCIISFQTNAKEILQTEKKQPFSFKIGYSNIHIDHKILGKEKIKSIEYIASYDFNHWGIWIEHEHQEIKKLTSNQYAIGGQYTFLKNKKYYALSSFGIGVTDINYSNKNNIIKADYIYYPLSLEFGYMPHPNVGAYITYGYKWLKNKNASIFYKNIEISDEQSEDFNLNGQTYSIGIRIAF